ncbi:MAG: universal stress protein, partial [Pseudomonadales bacterium]|nr:universal stress protein [Pseudomonadales bacterium]
MDKVKDLLVVMDRPKQRQLALQRGIALAKQLGARLHLAAFVHHDMYDQKDVFETSQRRAVRDALEAERSEWLADRVRAAKVDAADVTTEVVWE